MRAKKTSDGFEHQMKWAHREVCALEKVESGPWDCRAGGGEENRLGGHENREFGVLGARGVELLGQWRSPPLPMVLRQCCMGMFDW